MAQALPPLFLKTKEERDYRPMKFSLIPLLIAGKTISSEVRQALRENRLQDAAKLIVQEYGLTCSEVGDLLDVPAC